MAIKPLDVETLKSLLTYNPETGEFRWINAMRNKSRAGDAAGYVTPTNRLRIVIQGKAYYAHRLAWLYVHGAWPKRFIDHINGDPLDNRLCNLREATDLINCQNQRKAHPKSISKLLGTYKVTESRFWGATIRINGKQTHLGTFETPELAHQAYVRAKRVFHEGNTL